MCPTRHVLVNKSVWYLAVDDDVDSIRSRFAIEGGSGAELFRIDETSGDLFVADGADLASLGVAFVQLDVSATDFGEPEAVGRATLTIQIANDNQAPVFNPIEPFSVAEDAVPGTVVGTVSATDVDGDPLIYRIIGGTGRNEFSISSETGEIRVSETAELDFETSPTLSLVVFVIEDSEVPLSRTIEATISVTDVSEAPLIDTDSITSPDATVGRRFEFTLPEGIARRPNGETDGIELALVGDSTPRWLRFDPETRTFSGIPTSIRIGAIDVTLEATIDGATPDPARFTFQIDVAASDNLLLNTESPADVNGDDRVTPVDALEVINFIRRRGSLIDVTDSERIDGFFDVTGDRRISPADALVVINQIRRDDGLAQAEPGTSDSPAFIDSIDDATDKRTESQFLDSAIEALYADSERLF